MEICMGSAAENIRHQINISSIPKADIEAGISKPLSADPCGYFPLLLVAVAALRSFFRHFFSCLIRWNRICGSFFPKRTSDVEDQVRYKRVRYIYIALSIYVCGDCLSDLIQTASFYDSFANYNYNGKNYNYRFYIL